MSLPALAHRIREALFLPETLIRSELSHDPRPENLRRQLNSYLVFGAFALVYFWYYLPQGFTTGDDAYLPAVGQRIAEGQHLYTDFYYLRTPLSPLIQSAWISLFGAGYTFLFSRIVWALQLCVTVVVFSLIYRRWLSAIPLAVVLCATLVTSSLLFAFPWYTYDGMFFTAFFAYFALQRRFLIAGAFAGLAFLSKQGFVALLPVYLLLNLVEARSAGEPIVRWLKNSTKATAGALVVLAAVVLALNAPLPEIWRNVFVLPKSINDFPFSFLLYQDLPYIALNVWPLAATLFIILVAPLKSAMKMFALVVWLILSWSQLTSELAIFPWTLSVVSLATLSWFYLSSLRQIRGMTEDAPRRRILRISGLALVALYAAGFNYSGWLFSYIGSVISFPVLALWSVNWSDNGLRVAKENRESFSGGRLSLVLAGVVLLPSLFVHHSFPYDSPPRQELTEPFSTVALSGIYADSMTVRDVDGLVAGVLENSRPGDSILAFPDPASLNFLTGRPAWGPIQWHYKREFDSAMAAESVRLLYESPPALVVLADPQHIPETPRFDMLYRAVYDVFRPVDTVGPFHILVPQCEEGVDNSDDEQ